MTTIDIDYNQIVERNYKELLSLFRGNSHTPKSNLEEGSGTEVDKNFYSREQFNYFINKCYPSFFKNKFDNDFKELLEYINNQAKIVYDFIIEQHRIIDDKYRKQCLKLIRMLIENDLFIFIKKHHNLKDFQKSLNDYYPRLGAVIDSPKLVVEHNKTRNVLLEDLFKYTEIKKHQATIDRIQQQYFRKHPHNLMIYPVLASLALTIYISLALILALMPLGLPITLSMYAAMILATGVLLGLMLINFMTDNSLSSNVIKGLHKCFYNDNSFKRPACVTDNNFFKIKSESEIKNEDDDLSRTVIPPENN